VKLSLVPLTKKLEFVVQLDSQGWCFLEVDSQACAAEDTASSCFRRVQVVSDSTKQHNRHTEGHHGRPQKVFKGGQSRHFAYPFQVLGDVMQIDVHKTLHLFYTTKKMPNATATVA